MKLESILTVALEMAILLLLFLTVSFGASCNLLDDRIKDYCANPIVADNVDFNWVHKNFQNGWYLQFGNPIERKFISRILSESENVEDAAQGCLKMTLDVVDDHFIGYFYRTGNEDSQATFNCTGFDCTVFSSDKLSIEQMKVYLSYSDGKENSNLISVVLCFENGDVGWHASSVNKTISEEETKTLIQHYKFIGMNPELRIPFQSSSCS